MYSFRGSNNAFASSSSPISSLPVELLAEIFNICALSSANTNTDVEESEYLPPSITSECGRIPFILSSVNRRWRAIALSQSSLWSSICITPELVDNLDDPESSTSSSLNTSHILTCITRSRHYPLNILIDGRDPDWDFSEPDVGIDFGTSTFATLLTSEHMRSAIALLLPHMGRWKHLTILTDTWAPMYAALDLINSSITQFGAPLLQSMSLMRCNDYVSYSRRFQPRQLRDLGFLAPTTTSAWKARADLLPSLKHLSLRGVHVDWDSLGNILEASNSGLSSLELASHPKDVRPSMNQFHKLLKSTPNLRSLSVVGTGPEGPGSENDSVHNYESVYLPHLQDITIGYRTETGGRSMLHLLDAPNAKSLVLEDTTYPADTSEVNAGPILSYLGKKQCDGHEHRLEGSSQQSGSNETEKRRKRSICVHSDDQDPQVEAHPSAFPRLQHVSLRNVKASFQPLSTFFHSLSDVTSLELNGMSMLSIHALVPYSASSSNLPCPQLHSLTIKGSEFNVQDLDFIVCRLSSCRQGWGAPKLRDLNFHISPSRTADIRYIAAAAASSPDSHVHIISDKESASDEDEDDLMIDEEDEDAAFRPGGAFNDPEFDAYYAHAIATH